jgi:hypothetical protein
MSKARKLSDAVLEALHTLRAQVQTLAAAQRVWERVMTSKDRAQLGSDLAVAYRYQRGGTVGMWKRLRGTSGEQALIELGLRLGFIDQPTNDWLLRELGRPVVDRPTNRAPTWDRQRRELRLGTQVIRRVPRPNVARNVVMVLDAFEEAGWPPRIDDPLKAIHFCADGTGKGFAWRRGAPRSAKANRAPHKRR